MSASTAATTILVGLKHEMISSEPAPPPSVQRPAEDESLTKSPPCVSGASEILRSRLLCSNRNSNSYSSSNCSKIPPGVSTIIMSSSSGGVGPGGQPTAIYPKCNISVTVGDKSDQLTVITTSIGSARGGGESKPNIVPHVPNVYNPKTLPKLERLPEVEIKPLHLLSNGPNSLQSSGTGTHIAGSSSYNPISSTALSVTPISYVPLPATTVPPVSISPTTSTKVIAPQPVVKQEPAVLSISYDRERILTFLTDYWKSKNLQQVTEAQQQSAGVSGVTSTDFCPAPQRIVEEALFDLFVEYPMIIDGLPISKRAWAKAFYEKDIIQTSKVLFEALFSEQEMQQCTLNGKKGTPELSAIKMLAILRAAAWMKNKKQDPYSFNTNISSHNQFPSNEEREKIEKKVFTERRSQANRKITKTTGTGESFSPPHCPESLEPHNQPSHNNQGSPGATKTNSPTPPSPIVSSPAAIPAPAGENRLSLSEDIRREHMAPLAKIPRLDLDTEIVKQLQILYANSPEGLISYLLPEARTILIDGFLIPHDDWTKAFTESGTDIVKAAWTLFKVLFSKIEIISCTLNGKNGTKELCPVKKLAILRAVTWMKESQGSSTDVFSFNVRRPECNSFPTDEDKDKIETKVYTEKRYQACRKLKGQQV